MRSRYTEMSSGQGESSAEPARYEGDGARIVPLRREEPLKPGSDPPSISYPLRRMTPAPIGTARWNLLRFGRFSLDLHSGELRREHVAVEVAALPARLLRYLAANRERTVGKRELALEIWGSLDVGEATIQQAVRAARRAVGDDGRAQHTIQTASRVGYRFVADVSGDDLSDVRSHGLPLVGRRTLVAELETSIIALGKGHGALALLSGEPGIGKSRLLAEIERLASSRGLLVVRGGERAQEGIDPFWPWVDVFSGLSGVRPVEAVRRGAPHLLALAADGPIRTNEAKRFQHLEVAANCLRYAATLGPLVLLLEDLHRASPSSWDLLERIATVALGVPLLVIATHRQHELASDPARLRIRDRIASLPRVSSREVARLSDVESAYLIELAAGREVPAEKIPAVAGGTGGNPLVAVEFAHMLTSVSEPVAESTWQQLIGQGITRMLSKRIAELEPDIRSLLETAAAIGTTFDVDLLVRASPPGEPTLRALQVAVGERLVAEMRPDSGVFSFLHTLIRDAVYSGIADERDQRQAVHLRIADAIEAIQPLRHSELAHHVLAAGKLAGAARIVSAAEQAARSAAQGGEIDAAFAIYERASSTLAGIEPTDPVMHCALLVAAGELGVRSRRPEAARELLDTAIAQARQLERPELFARASLARAYRTEIVGAADTERIAMLEEAIEGLANTAPALTSQLRSRNAIELRYAPNGQQLAAAIIEQAISEAESSGDALAVARVLEDATLVLWSVSDPEGWLELNQRIVLAAKEAGDTELEFQGCKGIATARLELCEREAFDLDVAHCATIAEKHPAPFLRAVVSGMQASQAFIDGDFDRAERKILESGSSGIDDLAPLVAAQLFYHRLETGRLGELEEATRQFALDSPGIATWQAAYARLLIDADRHDEARAVLQQLPPLAGVARDRNWFPAMAMLAECARLLGDRDFGARVFTRIEPHASVGVVLGNATVFYGTGAHALGMLAALLGRLDEADRYLAQALRMHDGLRSEPWRLRTRIEQARVLAYRGERSAASELASALQKRADSMGMSPCARDAGSIALDAD